MELDDIERVRERLGAAPPARRDAGFDIVYVYGGHSYLPLQFLSRFYNKRTDACGGSFENRARFWLETLAAVREAVGDDCAIAVRFCVEALSPAGVELEGGARLRPPRRPPRRPLGRERRLDPRVVEGLGASRFFKEGYQLEWTGRVREATAKPIVGVGRLTNPDRMAEIVAPAPGT